jgi:hypothetical protein
MDDVQNMDLPTMSRTIKIVDGTKRLYIVECGIKTQLYVFNKGMQRISKKNLHLMMLNKGFAWHLGNHSGLRAFGAIWT